MSLNILGSIANSVFPSSSEIRPAAGLETPGGFSDVLKGAISQVSDLQRGADAQVGNMLNGNGSADMSKVMISVEKADVAFQLMMQVRNKIVSAYQDIEKMQF